MAEGALGRSAVLGTSAFLVTGLGVVLTGFFANQFSGSSSAGVSGLGTVFALVGAPIVAVLVGAMVGRGSTPARGAIAGAVAAGVGFTVEFFAVLVVSSALSGGGGAGGTVSAGGFVGYLVGIGLTGAGGGAVGATPLDALPDLNVGSVAQETIRVAAAFAAFGVGFAITLGLVDALGSGSTLRALVSAMAVIVVFVQPVVAVVTALLASTDDGAEGAVAGGLGGIVGSVVTLVAVYVVFQLVDLTNTGLFASWDPLFGVVIGVALTGAVAGYVRPSLD